MIMNFNSKIFIAGHKGMVGSAILRNLKKKGFKNLLISSRNDLDLTNYEAVDYFFRNNSIEIIYNCAAKVGGIVANSNYPADFILQNLLIQNNLFLSALKYSVKKIIFLGSCCIYPKNCKQPMEEEFLLTGSLEKSNEPYAVAKIAGIIASKALYSQYGLKSFCPMPINLYGPGDNWDPDNSHIIPGLMRRFHFAKLNNIPYTKVWGTGKAKREFMHVDDCADAIVTLTDNFYKGDIVNIAPGEELTTRVVAEIIANVVGYKGKLIQDLSKPDGTARKLASSKKIDSFGWKPKIKLSEGLKSVYEDFKSSIGKGRGLVNI